jgi:hypothetical protein
VLLVSVSFLQCQEPSDASSVHGCPRGGWGSFSTVGVSALSRTEVCQEGLVGRVPRLGCRMEGDLPPAPAIWRAVPCWLLGSCTGHLLLSKDSRFSRLLLLPERLLYVVLQAVPFHHCADWAYTTPPSPLVFLTVYPPLGHITPPPHPCEPPSPGISGALDWFVCSHLPYHDDMVCKDGLILLHMPHSSLHLLQGAQYIVAAY